MYEKERYGKRVERIGKWRKRERNRREKIRAGRRQSEPWQGTMEEKGGNGRETREKEKNMGE